MAALSGKVAWITGAGSGIGQAGAVELAKAGATVVISGRRAEALAETRGLVAAAGGEAHQLPLDVADKKQVAHAAKALLERHRRCDILVNSARPRRAQALPEGPRGGRLGQGHRDQPERRALLHDRGAARDARAGRGARHQHLVVARPLGRLSRRPRLRREQARDGDDHPSSQPRGRPPRHSRHRDLSRRGRDADPEDAAGAARAGGPGADAQARRPRPHHPVRRRDAAARLPQRDRDHADVEPAYVGGKELRLAPETP